MTTTRLLTLSAFLAFNTFIHAQSDWQWGISGGSFTDIPNSENVESMAVDADGNVFFVASVGPNNLTLDGMPQDFFGNNFMTNQLIGSYDCEGNYRWSRSIGGGANGLTKQNSNPVKIDDLGNVYFSGRIARGSNNSPNAVFGGIGFGSVPDTILPVSNSQETIHKQNLFIAKYNNAGVIQWLSFPQASNISNTQSIASLPFGFEVDPQTGHSFYLARLAQGSYADGAFEVSEADNLKNFILEYDTNGNFVSGTLMDFEINVANSNYKFKRNHQTGRYYLGGTSTTTNAFVVDGESFNGSFMACFDAQGNTLWLEKATDFYNSTDFAIDLEDNSLYLTGAIRNTSTFFGVTPQINSGSFLFASMLYKINEDGILIWHTIANVANGKTPNAITIMNEEVALFVNSATLDWQDYTIVPPQTNSGDDVYILRFNKYSSQIFDLNVIESNFGNNEYATTIAADPFGNYYAGGRFTQFMYIGDDTLLNGAPGTDFFVAKYGTDNCNCALPTASFTMEDIGNNQYQFTFTGTTEESTVVWDFGDENSSEDMNPVHSYATSGNYQVCATVTDVCGSTQFCTTIEATLSHSNPDFVPVRVYPNPTSSQLNIQSPEALQYEIYNLVGKSIQSGSISVGTTSLNVSEFPAGMYLLMLTQSDGARSSLKFVKY
jgi:PKD repeat protein